MDEKVLTTLNARNQFTDHLKNEIIKNEKILENTAKDRDKMEELRENIKSLGIYPEHESIIPLAKNIYMKGRIVHTGEYYIKRQAYPESYMVLKTLDQTVQSLDQTIKQKEDEIDKVKYATYQLEERLKILTGEGINEVSDELPKEIKSEKGVALKVGDFYEILEYES